MSQSSQTHRTAGTAVAGPFTVRDIVVGAGVVLLFLSSVMPLQVLQGVGVNLWNSAGLFQLGLGILLPVVVLVLFVVRRLAPQTPLRIGSLSVDQFASVVASLAVAFYFLTIVTVYSISGVIGFIGALVLFAGTVCARWIPQLAADFAGRPEVPAHPVARDAIAAAPRPKAPRSSGQYPGSTPDGTRTGTGEPATLSGAPGPAAGWTGAPGGLQPETSHSASGQAASTGPTPGTPDGDPRKVQQPATGQFAAPAGNGAAGVAGAAAAAQAAQPPGGAADASTPITERGTAASPTGIQRANELESDDSVSPGAADGEAVGIPVTEEPSGSSTTRAAASSADGVARDSGYSGKTVVGSPEGTGGRPAPAAVGADVDQRPGTAKTEAAERQAEPAVPAGGPLGGAAAAGTAGSEAGAGGTSAAGRGAAATTAMPSVAETGADRALADAAGASSPISATREHYEEAEAEEEYEAFWFAVGRTRPVLDENTGQVMFSVEPGSWILALQDRGDEFLVQHTDGRVGVLRDLTNIERA